MHRIIVSFFFALSMIVSIHAQQPYSEWIQTFQNTDSSRVEICDVKYLDSSYYVFGTLKSDSSSNVTISKFDVNGKLVETKKYLDKTGNLRFVFEISGGFALFTDFAAAVVDTQGAIIRSRMLPFKFENVQMTHDGGFLFFGLEGVSHWEKGTPTVRKTDSLLNEENFSRIEIDGRVNNYKSVFKGSDSCFYLHADCEVFDWNASYPASSTFLVKINSAGNMVYSKTLMYKRVKFINENAGNFILIFEKFYHDCGEDMSCGEPGSGFEFSDGYYKCKMDKDGLFSMENRIEIAPYAPKCNNVKGFSASHNGGFYVLAEGYKPDFCATVVKFDSDAKMIWSRELPGSEEEIYHIDKLYDSWNGGSNVVGGYVINKIDPSIKKKFIYNMADPYVNITIEPFIDSVFQGDTLPLKVTIGNYSRLKEFYCAGSKTPFDGVSLKPPFFSGPFSVKPDVDSGSFPIYQKISSSTKPGVYKYYFVLQDLARTFTIQTHTSYTVLSK